MNLFNILLWIKGIKLYICKLQTSSFSLMCYIARQNFFPMTMKVLKFISFTYVLMGTVSLITFVNGLPTFETPNWKIDLWKHVFADNSHSVWSLVKDPEMMNTCIDRTWYNVIRGNLPINFCQHNPFFLRWPCLFHLSNYPNEST